MDIRVRWAARTLSEVASAQPYVVSGQCEQLSHSLCPVTMHDSVELATDIWVSSRRPYIRATFR